MASTSVTSAVAPLVLAGRGRGRSHTDNNVGVELMVSDIWRGRTLWDVGGGETVAQQAPPRGAVGVVLVENGVLTMLLRQKECGGEKPISFFSYKS